MQKYSIIFGKHACEAVLNSSKREIYEILISNEDNIRLVPSELKKKIKKVSTREIEKLVKLEDKHQNIAIKASDYVFKFDLSSILANIKQKEYSCIFMLDEIQDPHNFGAIIRNAFGFEVDAVITTHHRSCPIGLGVLRSSAGYSEQVNLVESKNFGKTIETLKENDFWIVTLDSHENFSGSIEDLIKKYKKCAFIFGSEGPGVREQNKKLSDIRLRIQTNSKVESLNVSSISAIIGYEFFKFGKG